MTDFRHCDGPNCDEKAEINPTTVRVGQKDAERYITLNTPMGLQSELHFHHERCLTNWTKENTKVKEVPGAHHDEA